MTFHPQVISAQHQPLPKPQIFSHMFISSSLGILSQKWQIWQSVQLWSIWFYIYTKNTESRIDFRLQETLKLSVELVAKEAFLIFTKIIQLKIK